ncbi:DUF885 domain-containing protein [Solimonas soli]|uniref:DUF885 domain-containing protein n=1 Tax=Solimonas soli TaxID=413479 RepID=UPI000485A2D0|nr:DUF885 domain-containing protein [Solimonas soli]
MHRLAAIARHAVVVLLFVCGAAQADAGTQFRARFGDAFLDRYWALHPDEAISVGYYKYADRLPAPDTRHRAELKGFLDRSLAQLARLAPSAMDAAARTDYEVLRGALEAERWSLVEFRDWRWAPSQYNVADGFALLLDTPYAPQAERLRTVSKRLAQVPAYFAAARAAIDHPVREQVQLAIQQSEGSLDVFGDTLEKQLAGSALSAAERATFLRRLAAARQAISGYVAFLKALDARLGKDGGARDFRIGKADYDQLFAYTIQTGVTPEQLYARAQAEKERLHARMDVLAAQLWPTYFPGEAPPADRVARIGKLIARLSDQHLAPDRFYPEVKALIPRLEAWVRDHDLVTLDPSRPLEVRVTPPYMRGVSMASINAPGPYDAMAKTFFNVTPLDDFTPAQAESFLREYNRWLLQVLVIHEAVPGHYVQLIYANKTPSRIKSLFGNGAMIEGWAVYSERMMLESGWDPSPEMELMYSKWALRVVCNTLLDYGVHVQGLSEDDALKLLMNEAFQSETEARGKWRRVQLSYVQLASYFAGFSAIYDFRESLKAQLGARFDLKKFHERFLAHGSAPVAVITPLIEAEDVAR